jgi:hypothetical protein
VRPGSPACYECPGGSGGLHSWRRRDPSGPARCENCGLELSPEDTLDLYYRPESERDR